MMNPELLIERRAARKEARRIAKLLSIAHLCKVEGNFVKAQIDNVMIEGELENFNKIVERLGYRPIRLTRNLLNRVLPQHFFAIDIDTPSYCDPGCESYHSM